MQTFKFETIERRTLSVAASNHDEAKAIAVTSTDWQHEVLKDLVTITLTNDPNEIREIFEHDQRVYDDMELQRVGRQA